MGATTSGFDGGPLIQLRFNEITPCVLILQDSELWPQVPLKWPLNWSEVPDRLNDISPDEAAVTVPNPLAPVPPPPENVIMGGSLAR